MDIGEAWEIVDHSVDTSLDPSIFVALELVKEKLTSTDSAMDAMRRLGITIDHCHDKDECMKQVVGIINGYRAARIVRND